MSFLKLSFYSCTPTGLKNDRTLRLSLCSVRASFLQARTTKRSKCCRTRSSCPACATARPRALRAAAARSPRANPIVFEEKKKKRTRLYEVGVPIAERAAVFVELAQTLTKLSLFAEAQSILAEAQERFRNTSEEIRVLMATSRYTGVSPTMRAGIDRCECLGFPFGEWSGEPRDLKFPSNEAQTDTGPSSRSRAETSRARPKGVSNGKVSGSQIELSGGVSALKGPRKRKGRGSQESHS